MSRATRLLVLGMALGCRSQPGADSANAVAGSKPASAQSAVAEAGGASSVIVLATGGQSDAGVAGSSFALCGSEAPNIPHLATFAGAEIGKRYWVEMSFLGDTWQPYPWLRAMPHHRSLLELDNLDDFRPELRRDLLRQMRFTVQLTKHDVSKIPERNEWKSVFYARILRVCVLGDAR